jgi:hypothetical protein
VAGVHVWISMALLFLALSFPPEPSDKELGERWLHGVNPGMRNHHTPPPFECIETRNRRLTPRVRDLVAQERSPLAVQAVHWRHSNFGETYSAFMWAMLSPLSAGAFVNVLLTSHWDLFQMGGSRAQKCERYISLLQTSGHIDVECLLEIDDISRSSRYYCLNVTPKPGSGRLPRFVVLLEALYALDYERIAAAFSTGDEDTFRDWCATIRHCRSHHCQQSHPTCAVRLPKTVLPFLTGPIYGGKAIMQLVMLRQLNRINKTDLGVGAEGGVEQVPIANVCTQCAVVCSGVRRCTVVCD